MSQSPPSYSFRTDIQVRRSDTRSATVVGGLYVSHLTYETLIPLVNEAFDAFLESNSWSKADIAGANIIVPKMEVEYKSEAKAGDNLEFGVGVSNLGRKSCELDVFAVQKTSREEVAKAKIYLVFYDYVAKKTLEIPETFRKRFEV
ncbi:acyl-CoA thioesterase [Leptospira wolffii]|uniref:acyl-CoA thioesterase n=1 Tax=Leptospira wolffii TaxID=409998 RepID=UPI001083FCD5|nr:acyl-CoA thioesterase [Leptospira wolffii]TGK64742.1 acyl-CoA thioesterase [Leptospira wolffii]TGK76859.1 acyl-CoA thioesterase [Leptospira wolffii]TGK77289.1 acyl-CoA thioesterase [Leptospira wolffii]TGL26684.1 acyl-CoA thioesterase [Leptospira wolffii]